MPEPGGPAPEAPIPDDEPIEEHEAVRLHGRNPLYKEVEIAADPEAPRGPQVAFAVGAAVVMIGVVLLAIYWPVGAVIVGMGVLIAASGWTRTFRTSVSGGRKHLGPDHTPV